MDEFTKNADLQLIGSGYILKTIFAAPKNIIITKISAAKVLFDPPANIPNN